jgi:hypothetical protein
LTVTTLQISAVDLVKRMCALTDEATGEDTAGSPTSQNTEPGLAFFNAGKL